jgi:RNA polymerase sigma factor (TIGR02999 family)
VCNTTTSDVTDLLVAWRQGQTDVLDALMARVYQPLRRIAANQLRQERDDHTLQTAALVNEAYLRLVDQRRVDWRDRVHFFAVAARIMRRVLLDHARRHNTTKRGGDCLVLPLDVAEAAVAPRADLFELDRALDALAHAKPALARLVELRYFGGLTKHELATALDIAPATVTRRWRLARAWLYRFLQGRAIDVG